jgi:CubicO group peptidase (beta-lactamase class C family)
LIRPHSPLHTLALWTGLTSVALATLLVACSSDESGLTHLPEAQYTKIDVLAGDTQTGIWEEPLGNEVELRLTTLGGAPVANALLTLTHYDGIDGASVDSAMTDGDGEVSYAWWLGRSPQQELLVEFPSAPPRMYTSKRLSATARYEYRVPQAASDGWPVGDLNAADLDVDKITRGIERLRSGEFPKVHALLIARYGELLVEAYFPEDHGIYSRVARDNGTHLMASVHKSIVSTLVGLAIEDGYISAVTSSLYDYFPEYENFANWTAFKELLTLQDALTMRSGLTCSDKVDFWNRSEDWVKTLLDYPVSVRPGVRFNYCTEITHALGALVANASAVPLEEYARTRLFDPLEMGQVEWRYSPTGRAISGFEFWMEPRDMIKLGQLVLDGGQWNGVQMVRESWMQQATVKRVSVGNELGYSWQWWTRTFAGYDAVMAWGNGGQFVIAIRELDLIIGLTGGNYNSNSDDDVWAVVEENILGAVR